MFKKSQYLKKSAAHRQLTKLANAAQVIRVNRRLAKKAGAGMGDVVANTHSKPAAAGPQKPVAAGPQKPAPAYTPLAGRHPRRPKPVAKQPSEPIDLVIPHTNPFTPTSEEKILYGEHGAVTRRNPRLRVHAPYHDWDAQPGFYMMQAPFISAGSNAFGPEAGIARALDVVSVPGVHHSFNTVLLNQEQFDTLDKTEQAKYTKFERGNRPVMYARPMSSANAAHMTEQSAQSREADRAMRWLLRNHPGGRPLPIVNPSIETKGNFLGLPGAAHVNYIARVPLKDERYENNQWMYPRLPGESDAEFNARYAKALNDAANAAVKEIVKSPDYHFWDANCHLATMNGILNNPYLQAVRGATGGLRGAKGTSGALADTDLYSDFSLFTASDAEVQEASKRMAETQRNRALKKKYREEGGWINFFKRLWIDN